MKRIVTTLAVAKEIAEAISTAICGHAPNELSAEARKVYAEMEACDFDCELVLPVKSPKDESK